MDAEGEGQVLLVVTGHCAQVQGVQIKTGSDERRGGESGTSTLEKRSYLWSDGYGSHRDGDLARTPRPSTGTLIRPCQNPSQDSQTYRNTRMKSH